MGKINRTAAAIRQLMGKADHPSAPSSDVFATTLRDISGMVITIEKGTRVRVTNQQEEDARCSIHLTDKDNPTRIWNTICGVPIKYLQFDPQNAPSLPPATPGNRI